MRLRFSWREGVTDAVDMSRGVMDGVIECIRLEQSPREEDGLELSVSICAMPFHSRYGFGGFAGDR